MPELAEVEYFRGRWNPGLGQRITNVTLHAKKRVFRNVDVRNLLRTLLGSKLLSSETHGKQMLFRSSSDAWLGIHLGMTGSLRVEAASFAPGKHDHLILRQRKQSLVFNDPRQFGRVRFHYGRAEPAWWSNLPPSLESKAFTVEVMDNFLRRHRKLPIKTALLSQEGFPGIGNWMADEILWRTQLHPRTLCEKLHNERLRALWKVIRFVCRGAMKHVSPDFSDPPKGWLANERWEAGGICPLHHTVLKRETIGGRTTAWCPRCQQ